MTVILDAGALIGLEQGARRTTAYVRKLLASGQVVITHGGVVGQVWRGGHGRQARLAWYVRQFQVRPLDDALGRRAGVLLARTGTKDVIDAAVVLLANDGDAIVTSDADDLRPLADAAGVRVRFVAA